MKMKEEIELMELWMKEVQGFYDVRASHKYKLSLQMRLVIEGWLEVVDVQVKVDSMAAASFS